MVPLRRLYHKKSSSIRLAFGGWVAAEARQEGPEESVVKVMNFADLPDGRRFGWVMADYVCCLDGAVGCCSFDEG